MALIRLHLAREVVLLRRTPLSSIIAGGWSKRLLGRPCGVNTRQRRRRSFGRRYIVNGVVTRGTI